MGWLLLEAQAGVEFLAPASPSISRLAVAFRRMRQPQDQSERVRAATRAGYAWGPSRLSYRSPTDSARLVIVHCLNSLSEVPKAERILVIRLGAMGDVVRTLPALRSLRAHYPRAHISWLVETGAAGILEAHPDLDQVLLFPREALSGSLAGGRFLAAFGEARRFVRALRAQRFDLVLDFHSILKSGVLSRLSGAEQRIAYAPPYGREFGWLFANRRAALSPERSTRFERNLALLRFMGLTPEEGHEPLPLLPEAVQQLAASLAEDSAPVLIHPGSSAGALYKRYAPDKLAAVARQLVDEEQVECLVVTGAGRDEDELADRIVELAEGRVSRAPATPTSADLAALLARARLFIGSDSGPLHLASIVGTPVVQIMGPTHPLENEPYPATPWRRARVQVACSPCRRGCVQARCMQTIPSEQVVVAARELLRGEARDEQASRSSGEERAREGSDARQPGGPALAT